MGWTDTKPFSPAGKLLLGAALCAAVLAYCVHTIERESTMLAWVAGGMPLDRAMQPRSFSVPPKPTADSRAADAMGLDFSAFGPPTLWLVNDEAWADSTHPGWRLEHENPRAQPVSPARVLGPFHVTIWTEPAMGLWASTANREAHTLQWFGDQPDDLTMPEIRSLIADRWTTGGAGAIREFRAGDGLTYAPRPIGWAINLVSFGSFVVGIGLCYASYVVRRREPVTPETTRDPAAPWEVMAPTRRSRPAA